jgi:hypothetical protein
MSSSFRTIVIAQICSDGLSLDMSGDSLDDPSSFISSSIPSRADRFESRALTPNSGRDYCGRAPVFAGDLSPSLRDARMALGRIPPESCVYGRTRPQVIALARCLVVKPTDIALQISVVISTSMRLLLHCLPPDQVVDRVAADASGMD